MYLQFTADDPSPRRFRLWAAIFIIGAAAERRVWSLITGQTTYPNLFLFLVGPPGVGKTVAIRPATKLLRKSQAAIIAPNDMSKQGLLDTLLTCKRMAPLNGLMETYHFMAVCISELSNFMSQYDGELAGLLTDLFDCLDSNEEKKRGQAGDSKIILAPGLACLMGTATQNLGNTISNEMWGSGFMARVILIYSDQIINPTSHTEMFALKQEVDSELEAEIIRGLAHIGGLSGPMLWTDEAQIAMWDFRVNEATSGPTHNRLAHYGTRRWMHLTKLCMISALSFQRFTVEATDFSLAHSWLLDAEANMPEVFKDMVSHEDGQIYEELQGQLWQIYMKNGNTAIPVAWITRWLARRVSSYSIPRMLEVAETGEYLSRIAGTSGDNAMYIPIRPTGVKPTGVV